MSSGKQYCGKYSNKSLTSQGTRQLPKHPINYPSTSSTSSSSANEDDPLYSSYDSAGKRHQLADDFFQVTAQNMPKAYDSSSGIPCNNCSLAEYIDQRGHFEQNRFTRTKHIKNRRCRHLAIIFNSVTSVSLAIGLLIVWIRIQQPIASSTESIQNQGTAAALKCGNFQCKNGGTCGEDLLCNCDEGYTGSTCSLIDCFNHPCANGGTCQPGEQNSCNCADGYTGNRCQYNRTQLSEPCLHVNCQNNGTCLSVVDDFLCICDTAYFGRFCETSIEAKLSNMLKINDWNKTMMRYEDELKQGAGKLTHVIADTDNLNRTLKQVENDWKQKFDSIKKQDDTNKNKLNETIQNFERNLAKIKNESSQYIQALFSELSSSSNNTLMSVNKLKLIGAGVELSGGRQTCDGTQSEELEKTVRFWKTSSTTSMSDFLLDDSRVSVIIPHTGRYLIYVQLILIVNINSNSVEFTVRRNPYDDPRNELMRCYSAVDKKGRREQQLSCTMIATITLKAEDYMRLINENGVKDCRANLTFIDWSQTYWGIIYLGP